MGFPDMRLALTECMSVAPRADGPRSTNRHAEVLFFSGVMNACVRHRDFVELITRTATVNHGGGRAKLMGVVFPEPIHYLSALYAGIEGRRYCPVAADAPGYDVSTPGLPPLKDVPALDAIALMDGPGERLTVVVTNRDVHRAREATISFDAFHPAGEAGTATIAGDPGAYNVWEREPDVRLIHGSAPIEEPLTYTFPPASVVALTFTAAP
jgi:alpha-N-arabinofuranosidase